MIRIYAYFILLLCFFSTIATAAEPIQTLTPLVKPLPAPNFRLSDLNGKLHHLTDYRGKVVIINFWATWCPPCREEMPSMQRAWQKLKDKGIVMLAINVGEDEDTIFEFTADYPLGFPLLLDRDSTVIKAWPVRALPTTFILNRQGDIILRAIGGRKWDDPALMQAILVLQNK